MIWITRFDVWILFLFLERCYLNGYLRVSFYFLSDHQIFQRVIVVYRVHHVICAWILWHHSLHGRACVNIRCRIVIWWEKRHVLLDYRLNLLVHWHSLLLDSQIVIALRCTIDRAALSRTWIEFRHLNWLSINVFYCLFSSAKLSRAPVHNWFHMMNWGALVVIVHSWLHYSCLNIL